MYNCLINKLPALKLLTNYIEELLNIILKLNLPVIWITGPATVGLKIQLSTIKFNR